MKKHAWTYTQDWDIWLSAVLYVMRTQKRRDHGYSAFQLVYGRNPRTLLEDDDIDYANEEDEEDIILERIDVLIKLNLNIIPNAKENITKYRTSMIERYNKNAKDKKYYINDLVMVQDRNPEVKSAALLVQWLGPFRISEIVGMDVYVVKDGEMRLPLTYHANQLKLYKLRPRLSTVLKYYIKPSTTTTVKN